MAAKTDGSAPESKSTVADEPSRHLSLRLPTELYRRLEAFAVDGNESVSRAARRLLSDGLEPPGHQAIDQAISTMLLVRGQLEQRDPAKPESPPSRAESSKPQRTVDLFNAKTDLQHLLDDVARGDQIVITYAGTRRARLVPVDPHAEPPVTPPVARSSAPTRNR